MENDEKVVIKKNTIGLVGFILSIVSIFTVGLTAFVGLILSIIGLNDAKKCNDDKKILSIVGIVISSVMISIFSLVVISAVLNPEESPNTGNSEKTTNEKTTKEDKSSKKMTKSQEMTSKIVKLMKEDLAFDTGSYVQGDIPAGEYAFVKFSGSGSYYSEEDAAGNIIENENFDSFGYVKVHAAGDLETQGALINVTTFERLGVTGAKELYEILNDKSGWNQSGYYKVGVDIAPGSYVLESIGSGYYAIMTGPVGNSDIVDNDNFNGRASVNLANGQYINLSRAKFSQ